MLLWIGEILVDMIGSYKDGVMTFERHPGGAPFNAAVGAVNLGADVGFIGSVGNDLMGKFLIDFANTIKFSHLNISLHEKHNTTLAFVENDEKGERSFCFYRKKTADYRIKAKALTKIEDADIVCLGSLMLSTKEGIEIADEVVKLTKGNNKLLSFDINYRSDIYKSSDIAKKISLKYAGCADILKLSEDEVKLLSGENDIDLGIRKITSKNQFVLITLGSKGSRFYYKDMKGDVPSVNIKCVDTTGAGDAFYASVLASLDGKDLQELTYDEIVQTLKKANICGAMACTKKGAMSSLPTKEDLDNYLNK